MDAPTDRLVRALPAMPELRAADDDAGDTIGTLFGHFARFGEWTEIHSYFEGDFLERIGRGAFAKTIADRAGNLADFKVLFNHGHDNVGRQVLGVPEEVREDPEGVYYEVPLFDTSYNRDLLPGLRSGAYGASFMFSVIRDEWNDEPGVSDHNPKGLPERTIHEVRLYEFGPVTFPAYAGATAGARSLTDQFTATPTRPGTALDESIPVGVGAGNTPAAEPRRAQHSGLLTKEQRIRLLRDIELQELTR